MEKTVRDKCIAFVIPWRNRPELEASLDANRDVLSHVDCQVIIVNGNGDSAELRRIVNTSRIKDIRIVGLLGVPFNKCTCLNVGVRCSSAEFIFFLDCDVIISDELLTQMRAMLQPGAFVALKCGIESKPDAHVEVAHMLRSPGILECNFTTEFVFKDERKASIEHRSSPSGRSLCGLLYLSRKDFIRVGGWNSLLEGWGFEDYDMQIRLQAGIGLQRLTVGKAVHLTHAHGDPKDRKKTELANRMKCFTNYSNGNYQGTYQADIERWVAEIAITLPTESVSR